MLKGIDVSHHNGAVNWAKVKAAGIKFAFIKAAEGAHFKDGRFATNATEAQAAGIVVGAYHFFRPDGNGVAQAQHFLKQIKPWAHMLPPVVDVEAAGRMGKKALTDSVFAFIEHVWLQTGRSAIIYASPSFLSERMQPAIFWQHPLWVAHYGVKQPTVPAPWRAWTFWQYSEFGTVAGVGTVSVDMNYFNGDAKALQALAQKGGA